MYKQIKSFNEVLEQSKEEPVFIYKHSLTCPTAHTALKNLERFLESKKIETYIVTVQDEKELSNQIAEELDITHASPQLILIRDKKLVGIWNHYSITEKNIGDLL